MATADLAAVGQRPAGSPAVDVRGDAVEVWLVQVGLDELIRCALKTEPLIQGHQRPPRRALPGRCS